MKERGYIGSLIEWGVKTAASLAESGVPDDESSNPYKLLKAGVPLTTLVHKHGFDITELINDHRVTIRDFFTNGYTMSDMCTAFSRMNRDEGMDVVWVLGMTDAYLTQCPSLSQVDVMKSQLGFTPQHLIDKLGYQFVPGAWTMPQMIDAGLTMEIVKRQGMRTIQEFQQLASTARGTEDLIRFGVTQALIDDLLDENMLGTPAATQPPSLLVATPVVSTPAAPPSVTFVAPPPPAVQQVTVMMQPPQQRNPVVISSNSHVAYQAPVAAAKPVKPVTFLNPKSVAAPPPQKQVIHAAAAAVPPPQVTMPARAPRPGPKLVERPALVLANAIRK